MKKKALKITAFLLAMVLLGGLGAFANALVGNPVSKFLAERTAKSYLAEAYGDTDFVIDHISYSFKDGNYYAYIQSPSSADSYFSLSFNMAGKLTGDNYAARVLGGENTADRLQQAYRELTDSVFESSAFSFAVHIAFGDLAFGDAEYGAPPAHRLTAAELELDRLYDIRALGAEAGYLTVYIDDENVCTERAAEILLEIKRLMDEGGAPFYAIDLVLQYPKPEEGHRPEVRVEVRQFLYSDIYETGMTGRVDRASSAAEAYYNAMDAEKGTA